MQIKAKIAFIVCVLSTTAFGANNPNPIVVVGKEGTILTSSNGIDWTKQNSPITTTISAVTHSPDQYTALAYDFVGYTVILQSPDGINWTSTDLNSTFRPSSDIMWDGKEYMGANSSWGSVYTSTNGLTWVEQYSAYPARMGHLAMSTNRDNFITVGGASSQHACTGAMATSKDGYSWTTVSQDFPCLINATWSHNQFFVTATKGGFSDNYEAGILVGLDNTWTWQAIENGAGKTLLSITANEQTMVAVGRDEKQNKGIVYMSSDANTWQQINTPAIAPLQKVLWTHNLFVAVGDQGAIMTSPDGANWTVRNSHATSSLLGIS